jgi:hypothetical protein
MEGRTFIMGFLPFSLPFVVQACLTSHDISLPHSSRFSKSRHFRCNPSLPVHNPDNHSSTIEDHLR